MRICTMVPLLAAVAMRACEGSTDGSGFDRDVVEAVLKYTF